MLIVLFIILLWNVILTLTGKADRSRAFCGMVGYCGGTPGDAMLIRMLMMYNKSRGEDSTGWAINNQITKDTKKVDDFLQANQIVISESDKNYTIIAHARKASSGLRSSKDHAHPFGIFKDGVESGNYDLILAMNGTLQNEDAIAEKYDFDFKKNVNSDTEMIAKLMAKLGPKEYLKLMEEYSGIMSLLFFTPKTRNTLFVYRDPQRAVFYWKRQEDQMYVSSMKESFLGVGAKEEDIKEFEDNTLYKIVKGNIVEEKKMERSPIFKAVPIRQTSPYSHVPHGAARNNPGNFNLADYYTQDISKLNMGGDKLVLVYDKYFRNHHGATGGLWVNDKGEILTLKSGETHEQYPEYKLRWFVAGYMVKSEEAFKKLAELVMNGSDVDWPKLQKVKTSEILEFVDYPIITIPVKGEKEKFWIIPAKNQEEIEGNGTKEFYHVHWLGEYKLVFSSGNRRITGTNILCYNLKSWNKLPTPKTESKILSRVDILKDAFSDTKVEDFVTELLTEEPNILAKDLFEQARTHFFKMNGDDSLRMFFWKDCILDFAFNKMVADTTEIHNITITAEKQGWDAFYVYTELNKIIKKLSKKINETPPKADIKDIESLSPRQRMAVGQFDPTGISVKSTVEELSKTNMFLSMEKFNSDIQIPTCEDYNELAGLYVERADEVNANTADFAIAVLLKLRSIERVGIQKMIDVFKMGNTEMIGEVRQLYEDYVRGYINDRANTEFNEMLDKEKTFHEVENPGDWGDTEANEDDIEGYDPEETEDEKEDAFNHVMYTLDLFIKDCVMISEQYRTPRITELEKHCMEARSYLKKWLVDQPEVVETIPV